MATRREFVRACCVSAVVAGTGLWSEVAECQDTSSDIITEDQRGDPDITDEYITFSPSAIRKIATSLGKATFEEWDANLPLSMITTARSFIGSSRKTSPEEIAQFLGLFDLPLSTANGYVPFCAAGLSYCALKTYASRLSHSGSVSAGAISRDRLRKLMPDLEHYYFYPTVSCVDMYHIAAGKRKWVAYDAKSPHLPKQGWIVLYDWNKRGIPDHCGLVQQATKEALVTIEFNTSTGEGSQRNGGTVAQKTRTYDSVTGFVITDAKPS
jgi:hypothetical protein